MGKQLHTLAEAAFLHMLQLSEVPVNVSMYFTEEIDIGHFNACKWRIIFSNHWSCSGNLCVESKAIMLVIPSASRGKMLLSRALNPSLLTED